MLVEVADVASVIYGIVLAGEGSVGVDAAEEQAARSIGRIYRNLLLIVNPLFRLSHENPVTK